MVESLTEIKRRFAAETKAKQETSAEATPDVATETKDASAEAAPEDVAVAKTDVATVEASAQDVLREAEQFGDLATVTEATAILQEANNLDQQLEASTELSPEQIADKYEELSTDVVFDFLGQVKQYVGKSRVGGDGLTITIGDESGMPKGISAQESAGLRQLLSEKISQTITDALDGEALYRNLHGYDDKKISEAHTQQSIGEYKNAMQHVVANNLKSVRMYNSTTSQFEDIWQKKD